MAEMKENLEKNGFQVTKWGNRRGILLAYPGICVQIQRAPEAGQSDFKQYVYPHAEGKWLELKAAEFSKKPESSREKTQVM